MALSFFRAADLSVLSQHSDTSFLEVLKRNSFIDSFLIRYCPPRSVFYIATNSIQVTVGDLSGRLHPEQVLDVVNILESFLYFTFAKEEAGPVPKRFVIVFGIYFFINIS